MRSSRLFRSVSGVLAGILTLSVPVSSFADAPGILPSGYATGLPKIEKLLSDYAASIRSGKDAAKFAKFAIETANGYSGRKISDALREELVKYRLDTVAKSALDAEVPSAAPSAVRKAMVDGLRDSVRRNASSEVRLIVKTSLSEDELTKSLEALGNVTVSPLPGGAYQVKFPKSGAFGKGLSSQLDSGTLPTSLIDGVEVVKPLVVQGLVSSGAYLTGETVTWGIGKLGASDYQYGLSQKAKVKVAVIDTGISLSHSDLSANIATNAKEIPDNGVDDDGNGFVDDYRGYNFYAGTSNADDDNGHGTHVAGIIAGGVNGSGVFGVDSNVSLVPLKVLSASGYGSTYGVIDAINYAANNGIKILNLSLGASGTPSSDPVCAAITSARSKGTLAVVAAGNENADTSAKIPAGCTDALTVAAVDSSLTKAYFSNYGAAVDVAAPGVGIYSTYPGSQYATMDGTSMATPFVAGLSAAMLAVAPNSTPTDIENSVRATSNTVPVTSSVNIGRFVSMRLLMSSLGIPADSDAGSGTTDPGTGSGSTGSGSTGTPPANQAPTVTVSAAKTGTNAYLVTATASDADGKIVRYEFYKGSVLAQSGSSSSYALAVTANTTVTVQVFDDSGASASASVNLAYSAPVANVAPSVTLKSTYLSKTSVSIRIDAKDSDGTLKRVQIFINGVQYYDFAPNASTYGGTLTLGRSRYSNTVKVIVTDNAGAQKSASITVK